MDANQDKNALVFNGDVTFCFSANILGRELIEDEL